MYTLEEVRKLVDDSLDKSFEFYQQNRLEDSERILSHILENFDTEEPRGLQLLGLIKYQQKKYEEAIELFEKAISVDPKNAENHNNLGLCQSALGDYSTAMQSMHRSVKLKPESHLYYSNIAHQFRSMKKYDKALEWFRYALDKNMTAPDVLHNIGGCYFEMGKIEKTITYMNKAVEFDPENFGMKVDLAYVYQAAGMWEKAWDLYESRVNYFKQMAYFKMKYDQNKFVKKGDCLEGKTVILYCEQGIGDLIQSLRFVNMIENSNLIIECPESMTGLLEANGYSTTVDGSVIDHDFHCSIMSLPYLLELGENFEEIAKVDPYLKAHKKANLEKYDDNYKIGIAWAGNPMHPKDKERSCYLKEFERLGTLSKAKIFSLQKDVRKRVWPPQKEPVDLTTGSDNMRVVDMSEYLDDWQSTAAILESMDVVVTVDTSILHLAGALGIETYMLVPNIPDTRWGLEGEDTFWYPTVHVIRQEEPENWKLSFKKITRLLVDNIKSKSS
ncbi:MAG: tetratricopeptide repeat-containing glycosyltransferase family protein [Candidatus Thorarchaeota archaeon]|jgi:tetratricopeptide (TPR) repeat protein